MIIRTRYRDVPWEEVAPCMAPRMLDGADRWHKWRGKPMQIQTPAMNRIPEKGDSCKGPYYLVTDCVGKDGAVLAVCPHIAEIGD